MCHFFCAFCRSRPEDQQTAGVENTPEGLADDVYFERLNMRLGPEGAAELLNEYYDELNNTVSDMKDLRHSYDKLSNLNKCNMNMLRREMSDWAEYYRKQAEQTTSLITKREAELRETRIKLNKTLSENERLKETNTKLEQAVNNERMKLRTYIQQNIKERVKQMTQSLSASSDLKEESTPSEKFLRSKPGASNERKLAANVKEVNKSPRSISEGKYSRNEKLQPEAGSGAGQGESTRSLQRGKKPNPKVFLNNSQECSNGRKDRDSFKGKFKSGIARRNRTEAAVKQPSAESNSSPERIANVAKTQPEALAVAVQEESQSKTRRVQAKGDKLKTKPDRGSMDVQAKPLKSVKAKEYEDVSPRGPKARSVVLNEARSLDEPLLDNQNACSIALKPIKHKIKAMESTPQ